MTYLKSLSGSLLIFASFTSPLAAGFIGSAAGFAVLAGSTITNTGNSVIIGDIGVSPGSAITGFPPGTVSGTIHFTDTATSQAETDANTAYVNFQGLTPGTNLSNTDLGGRTLTSGVYKFDAAAALTGVLTLSGTGNFIFQIGSAFNVANNSSIVTTAGADPNNIYFQIGSSATVGTGDAVQGNLIANQSISFGTGSSLHGRALALNAAVTLQDNAITATNATTPEPTYFVLLGVGLAILVLRKTVFPLKTDERCHSIQK